MPPDEGIPPFRSRLRQRAIEPTVLAGLPAAAALCLFRLVGLVAPIPYWSIFVLVFAAQAVSIVAAALWAEDARGWHLTAYVGTVMGVIGVVAYSTGWGPILSLGFIFGAGYALHLSGSAAAKPAMVWIVVDMGIGEIAISVGAAPSLIAKPLVHGIAGLGLLGVLLTVTLLGRSTAAREIVEDELRQSEGRFKALVRNASDIIVVVDRKGGLHYVSPAFERILGIAPEQLRDRRAFELLHPDDLARMRSVAGAAGSDVGSGTWREEVRLQHADGSWRWFEASITDRLEDPNVEGIVANLHDITTRKQAEEELREVHERFQSAFENAPIGMALTDVEGRILRANPAMGRIVGHDEVRLEGVSVHDLTHPDDRASSRVEMRRLVSSSLDGYRSEKRFRHSEGREVWVSVSVSCVRDENGGARYFIGQVEDVTERRALRERLAYEAIHDPLTALPNRVLFMDRLETALSRASRHDGHVAVLFLDLDRFKLVNDSMGHAAGDRLLEIVADRLRRSMRPSDTVARFGGDEFVVLCDEVADEATALEVAQRLAESLRQAVPLPEGEVFVTASLGMALSGTGDDSAAGLLRDADTAMYVAKERGRSRIEVFDPRSHDVVLDRMRTRSELHGALERDELRAYYQPIVELATGRVAGVEALLRWEHPERGLLHPGEFLGIAEESGLMVPIGTWVLEQACRQVVAWEDERRGAGFASEPLIVSVNLSPRQLVEAGLVDDVATVLAATGVAPGSLWLEITEGALAADTESTLRVLQRLGDLGVRLAIDDFGTGYASLGYLKSFPVGALKIDRSFVVGLGRGADDTTIVGSVVALARSLGLECVAEGIEHPRQLDELRRLGCEYVQGFLLGVPLPAEVLGPQLRDDLSPWTVNGAPLFEGAAAFA